MDDNTAEQTNCLFEFLRREYEKSDSKATGAYTALAEFVKFAAEYMSTNQPTATYYEDGALGLLLQQGQRLALTSTPTPTPTDTSVPITTVQRTWSPGGIEISGMGDDSVSITGTDE
jgi:hypothetical protein